MTNVGKEKRNRVTKLKYYEPKNTFTKETIYVVKYISTKDHTTETWKEVVPPSRMSKNDTETKVYYYAKLPVYEANGDFVGLWELEGQEKSRAAQIYQTTKRLYTASVLAKLIEKEMIPPSLFKE